MRSVFMETQFTLSCKYLQLTIIKSWFMRRFDLFLHFFHFIFWVRRLALGTEFANHFLSFSLKFNALAHDCTKSNVIRKNKKLKQN